ncbi:hypothetical protein ACU686_00540 [Yinghuangia aomiensis]
MTAASGAYAVTFAARLLAGAMGGVLWAMLVGYAACIAPPRLRGARAIALALAGITARRSPLGIPAGTTVAAYVALGAARSLLLALLGVAVAAWARRKVPDLPGEAAAERTRCAGSPSCPAYGRSSPGHAVSAPRPPGRVTRTSHRCRSAPVGDRTGVVLLVFGGATVVGIWAARLAVLADRRPRAALVAALAGIAAALTLLGAAGGLPPVVVRGRRFVGCRLRRRRRRSSRPRW